MVEQNEGRHLLLAEIEPIHKLFQPLAPVIIPMSGFTEGEHTDVVFLLDHAEHLTKKHMSPLYDFAMKLSAGSPRWTMDDGRWTITTRLTRAVRRVLLPATLSTLTRRTCCREIGRACVGLRGPR